MMWKIRKRIAVVLTWLTYKILHPSYSPNITIEKGHPTVNFGDWGSMPYGDPEEPKIEIDDEWYPYTGEGYPQIDGLSERAPCDQCNEHMEKQMAEAVEILNESGKDEVTVGNVTATRFECWKCKGEGKIPARIGGRVFRDFEGNLLFMNCPECRLRKDCGEGSKQPAPENGGR